MPARELEEAGAEWLRGMWRPLASEAVSTALLVALGCASLAPDAAGGAGGGGGVTAPAFAFGMVVLGNAMAFGPASGAHMNPAVSVAAALCGCVSWRRAAAYSAAQCAGAVLGFGALQWAVPFPGGCTEPAPGVPALQAAALEALMTGALVLALCSLWAPAVPAAPDTPAPPDHAAPVKLGLLVVGLVHAGGRFTGASLNPARSLASALFQNYWRAHWVYWAGPVGGAALAALLHRHVLAAPRARRARPADAHEVPLHDKDAC